MKTHFQPVPPEPLSSGLLQRKCACGQQTIAGGECSTCKNGRETFLQRSAFGSHSVAGVPSIVHDVLRSPGQPLDAGTRGFLEPRFGYDFSHVRVHTDAKAAESARAVSAHAYTVGNNVVFGAGEYLPLTTIGRRLIAHELGHVVQQQNASFRYSGLSDPTDSLERDADKIADSILAGGPAPVAAVASHVPSIQRSSNSSGSSSSGPPAGGPIPTPTRRPDNTCECRLDICWRPIQAYGGIVGALGYSHGFLNMFDSRCGSHNLYVDPSMHKAGSTSHSHAVDSSPGWDTSGTTCHNLSASMSSIVNCTTIDRIPAAVARYEAMDVSYDARNGPNSNSFLEWVMYESGISISSLPSGLMAWDYYVRNPAMRSSPPRVTRAAAPVPPSPAPAPARP